MAKNQTFVTVAVFHNDDKKVRYIVDPLVIGRHYILTNFKVNPQDQEKKLKDTFILRPGDEGYIEPRSDAVQNQPILINSGKDEFVDDPEIPQKDDSKTDRKKVLLKTQVFTYKNTWRRSRRRF